MTFEPMRVIRLTADNFKRLQAVDITPEGDVVEITGRNGAGKTSVLDAIWTALAGKAAAPPKPVHGDAEKATIRLDLGEIVITRKFSANGSTSVAVETAEGARYKSPQHLLDSMLGDLSFDPFAFMREKAAAQAEHLRAICSIDTSALDGRRARLYENRTEARRELKRIEGEVASFPGDVESFPKAAPDIAEITAELAAAHATNAEISNIRSRYDESERRLVQLRDEIEKVKAEWAMVLELREELLAKLNASNPYDDIAPLEEAMGKGAADTLDAVTRAKWAAATEKRIDLAHEVEELSSSIERVDADKAELLDAIDLPVEGLALGDDHLLFNGVPLEQASMAEQLRVSVAIAMRSNPTIRVIRIADGSLLDSASMAALREMAGEREYQVFVERVAEGPGIGIYIEDGAVHVEHEAAE